MSDLLERSHRYTVTPEHLIFDPMISDRAFRLWCRLDRFAGDRGTAFPYRETLSVELNCSLASVDRALAELVEAEWVEKTQQLGDRCIYRLLVVPSEVVMERVEKARAERKERWGGQRRRQRHATKERQSSQMEGGVVTDDDRVPSPMTTGAAATGDGSVSSPMTPSVVTGGAHKEASLEEASGKEGQNPAADATEASDAKVIDFPGADGATTTREPTEDPKDDLPEEIRAARRTARRLAGDYQVWYWRKLLKLPEGTNIPNGKKDLDALAGAAKADPLKCTMITAALLGGFTEDQIKIALGRYAQPFEGAEPPDCVPTQARLNKLLGAVAGGVQPRGARPPSNAHRPADDRSAARRDRWQAAAHAK